MTQRSIVSRKTGLNAASIRGGEQAKQSKGKASYLERDVRHRREQRGAYALNVCRRCVRVQVLVHAHRHMYPSQYTMHRYLVQHTLRHTCILMHTHKITHTLTHTSRTLYSADNPSLRTVSTKHSTCNHHHHHHYHRYTRSVTHRPDIHTCARARTHTHTPIPCTVLPALATSSDAFVPPVMKTRKKIYVTFATH